MSGQKMLETRPYLRGDVVALGYSRTRLCQILSDLSWINQVSEDFRLALDHVSDPDDTKRGEEVMLALTGDDAYVRAVPPARLQFITWAFQQNTMFKDPTLRAILTPAKNRLEDYLWEHDINPTHGAQFGEGADVSALYQQQAELFLENVRSTGSRLSVARVRSEQRSKDESRVRASHGRRQRVFPS